MNSVTYADLSVEEDAPMAAKDTDIRFERHVARLLVVLYECGDVVNDLLSGESRQIASRARLNRFDFWVREPGYMALALLHGLVSGALQEGELVRAAIVRIAQDDSADLRRIPLPGGRPGGDLDDLLSFLTARALVADRPAFTKAGGPHKIILDSAGVAFVPSLLEASPMARWYQAQAVLVRNTHTYLERIDVPDFLAQGILPPLSVSTPLSPVIRARLG